MIKRMMWTTLVLTLLISNIAIWTYTYDHFKEKTASSSKAKEKMENSSANPEVKNAESNTNRTEKPMVKAEPVTSSHSNYFYAISDNEIKQAIQMGVHTQAKDYEKPYRLDRQNQSGTYGEIAFTAEIVTPYHQAARYAALEYFKEDEVISVEEVRERLNDDFLDFSLDFRGVNGLLVGGKLVQDGNEIMPKDTINDEIEGKYKVLSFSVSDIDFNQPAVLKVFIKGKENEEFETYSVHFNQYK